MYIMKYGAITTNADFLYSSTHECIFMVLLIFINLIGATNMINDTITNMFDKLNKTFKEIENIDIKNISQLEFQIEVKNLQLKFYKSEQNDTNK